MLVENKSAHSSQNLMICSYFSRSKQSSFTKQGLRECSTWHEQGEVLSHDTGRTSPLHKRKVVLSYGLAVYFYYIDKILIYLLHQTLAKIFVYSLLPKKVRGSCLVGKKQSARTAIHEWSKFPPQPREGGGTEKILVV